MDAEMAAAKLSLTDAENADTASMKARGEFIHTGDAERKCSSVLRCVRAEILALPLRQARRLGHLTPNNIAAIDRETQEAL